MIKYGGDSFGLDIYSWSTVSRLQLWLMLYSSAYASTALANALQLLLTLYSSCLRSTALAYAATAFDLLMLLQKELVESVRGNVEPFV